MKFRSNRFCMNREEPDRSALGTLVDTSYLRHERRVGRALRLLQRRGLGFYIKANPTLKVLLVIFIYLSITAYYDLYLSR